MEKWPACLRVNVREISREPQAWFLICLRVSRPRRAVRTGRLCRRVPTNWQEINFRMSQAVSSLAPPRLLPHFGAPPKQVLSV